MNSMTALVYVLEEQVRDLLREKEAAA